MVDGKVQLNYKLGTNPKTKAKLWYLDVESGDTKTLNNIKYDSHTLSAREMAFAVDWLKDTIIETISQGDKFKIEGLGTFRLKVTAGSATNKSDLTIDSVSKSELVFTPELSVSKALKKKIEYTLKGQNLGSRKNTSTDTSDDTSEDNRVEVESMRYEQE